MNYGKEVALSGRSQTIVIFPRFPKTVVSFRLSEMFPIDLRELLALICQRIDWVSGRDHLLRMCRREWIEEGSETNIQDAHSLFQRLLEKNIFGIDDLEVLKKLVRKVPLNDGDNRSLLDSIEKLKTKRNELKNLLQNICRELSLDESMVSDCKGRIPDDALDNINDVPTLLKELERNDSLTLNFLKVLIGTDKPALIAQVEDFETEQEQERKREENMQRIKGKGSLTSFC